MASKARLRGFSPFQGNFPRPEAKRALCGLSGRISGSAAGEPLGVAVGVPRLAQQHSLLLAGHVAIASKRSSNSLAAWTTA